MSFIKRHIIAIVSIVALMSAVSPYVVITNDHPVGYHYFHVIHLDDDAIRVGNTVIQPLVFSKDHDYDFIIKDASKPLKIEIRDDHDKLVATNFDAVANQYYQNMIFECHISEMYKIVVNGEEIPDGAKVKIFSKAHDK